MASIILLEVVVKVKGLTMKGVCGESLEELNCCDHLHSTSLWSVAWLEELKWFLQLMGRRLSTCFADILSISMHALLIAVYSG